MTSKNAPPPPPPLLQLEHLRGPIRVSEYSAGPGLSNGTDTPQSSHVPPPGERRRRPPVTYPLSARDLINPSSELKMRLFSLLATVLAALAYFALLVSVFSHYWLFTYESLVKTVGSNETKMTQEVHSGLWKFCYNTDSATGSLKVNVSELPWKLDENFCVDISFSGREERASSTMGAIQTIVRNTVWYPCVCLVILFLGLAINLAGHCTASKHVFFFVSGIFFVVSGLVIILSLVIYAANTNAIAEGWPSVIGNHPAQMEYSYGWSFFLCGCSLLASEAAGVFALYYFLAASSQQHKEETTRARRASQQPTVGILKNSSGPPQNQLAEPCSAEPLVQVEEGTAQFYPFFIPAEPRAPRGAFSNSLNARS